MAEPWRIELFGGLRVRSGNHEVDRFPTRKSAALLARLAYQPERRFLREELLDLFWPEMDPEAARHNLRSTLHTLKKVLRTPGSDHSILHSDNAHVWLEPDSIATDVAEFESQLPEGCRSEAKSRAIELYRGELLAGFYDEWIFPERRRLESAYLKALQQTRSDLERDSDPLSAANYAHRLVAADPLNEESHLTLIRLLAAAGEPKSVQRQFDEMQRALREGLDEDVSDEARDVYKRSLGLANRVRRARMFILVESFGGKVFRVRKPIAIAVVGSFTVGLAALLLQPLGPLKAGSKLGGVSPTDFRIALLPSMRNEFARGSPRERSEAHRKHAAECVDLGDRAWSAWYGSDEPAWLARIEAAHDDFRAAIAWLIENDPPKAVQLAGALTRFWYLRGFRREGFRALSDAIAASNQRTEYRARALIGCGFLSPEHNETAKAQFQEALAIYRERNDSWGQAHALRHLGFLASERQNPEAAAGLYNDALAIFTRLGDKRGQALTLLCLAFTPVRSKSALADSERYASRSLALFKEIGNPWGISFALDHLGVLEHRKGNGQTGRQLVDQAVNADTSSAFPAEREEIARFRTAGNMKAAITTIRHALQNARDQGSAVDAAWWLHEFAGWETNTLASGNPEIQLLHLAMSSSIDRALGIQRLDSDDLMASANLLRLQKSIPHARYQSIIQQAAAVSWEHAVDEALAAPWLKLNAKP